MISFCAAGAGIALACGGDWGPEYGTSNFTPEVFVDSAYSPFFYTQVAYYHIGFDDEYNTRFSEQNVRDWQGYLDRKPSKEELKYLLDDAGIPSIDSALAWAKGRDGWLPAGLQSVGWGRDKKTVSFLQYLRLARMGEHFSVKHNDYWAADEKKDKKPVIDSIQLKKDLATGFAGAKDPFMKERYWFQLLRYYFFTGFSDEVITLFDREEKSFQHDKLYYRGLAYTAGAWFHKKNYGRSNYLYSRVYDGCNELKTIAHQSFLPKEESDWKATLALCRNSNEQAVVWQMLGLYHMDEQRAIGEIYKLDPKSPRMDLLLARAVNRSEQSFSTGADNPYGETRTRDSADASLLALTTRIATAGNTAKPWMWQLATGYLYMLDGKYETATAWLSKAE
ncbi:MAG: hypothetical protein JST39_18385, partial [Bacteroidetes bacterium]|nr:hypothetical protein [Bacteroidota bacterium]